MEPHVLTCVPAYGYIFHTLEVYLYPTCTAPSQSGVYLELNQATVMESFCKNNTFHQQTHTHTHTRSHTNTVLKFVGILTKYVGKIFCPNTVGKSGVFYHNKQNPEFYQYSVPQKLNFYRQRRLL